MTSHETIVLSHTTFLLYVSCNQEIKQEGAPSYTIKISYPQEHYDQVLDGRLMLLISKDEATEPRFQLKDNVSTCQAFGMDVEDWQPGSILSFDLASFGYPINQIHELPSDQYNIQILFHKYEIFKRF